jgi:hypothetical protein
MRLVAPVAARFEHELCAGCPCCVCGETVKRKVPVLRSSVRCYSAPMQASFHAMTDRPQAGRGLRVTSPGHSRRLVSVLLVLLVMPSLSLSASAVSAQEATGTQLDRATAKATAGKAFFKDGLYKKAADEYMEAYAISKRPALMYNAARAYEEGQMAAEAVAVFKMYEELETATSQGRDDARDRRVALQRELDSVDGTVAAKPPWRRTVGWGGVVVGGVALAVGGWLWMAASTDQSALDAKTNQFDGNGQIVGVQYSAYSPQQKDINGQRRIGVWATVTGVALGLTGAWLVWRKPSEQSAWTILTGPRGGAVTWRF